MKSKNFVVDPKARKALASFPSFKKAKEFQIQNDLLDSTEIWGFDPAELRLPPKKTYTIRVSYTIFKDFEVEAPSKELAIAKFRKEKGIDRLEEEEGGEKSGLFAFVSEELDASEDASIAATEKKPRR